MANEHITTIPRLVVSAPGSGSGKTTVTLALLAHWTAEGRAVQPFKVGPDYIDGNFHQAVTGRPSWNLDGWMEPSHEGVRDRFLMGSETAGLAVIEGVMGLFDGRGPGDDAGSTAEIARILQAPILLVMDVSGMAASAAALVQGFQSFDPRVRIGGVIANRVGSASHYALIKDAVENRTGVPCLGYLEDTAAIQVPERHLGLARLPKEQLSPILDGLVQRTQKTFDWNGIEAVMQSAPPLAHPTHTTARTVRPASRPVVAVAHDEAFWFYYPANLALLREMGAELQEFSPLRGHPIPVNATHLFWGGGFPEGYLPDLSRHSQAFDGYRERIGNGLKTLAECGGYMALGEAVVDGDGRRWPMVGIIPLETRMEKRLQGFGYRTITIDQTGALWSEGTQFRGHEFHHSRVLGDAPAPALYHLEGTRGQASDGFFTSTLMAGYAHLYFPSNPDAVYHWLYGQEGSECV